MQALEVQSTSLLAPVAAALGLVWGATLAYLAPTSAPGIVLALAGLGALLQWSALSISRAVSQQLAGIDGVFGRGLLGLTGSGVIAAALGLPLVQHYTHHRPLGGVSAAVLVLGVAVAGGIVALRLPVSTLLSAQIASWLPQGLLLGASTAFSGTPRLLVLLGAVAALGLRAISLRSWPMLPGWVNSLLGASLVALSSWFALNGALGEAVLSLLG